MTNIEKISDAIKDCASIRTDETRLKIAAFLYGIIFQYDGDEPANLKCVPDLDYQFNSVDEARCEIDGVELLLHSGHRYIRCRIGHFITKITW